MITTFINGTFLRRRDYRRELEEAREALRAHMIAREKAGRAAEQTHYRIADCPASDSQEPYPHA